MFLYLVYERTNSLNTVRQNTNHKTQFVISTNSYLSNLRVCILEFGHSNILKMTVRSIDILSAVFDLRCFVFVDSLKVALLCRNMQELVRIRHCDL